MLVPRIECRAGSVKWKCEKTEKSFACRRRPMLHCRQQFRGRPVSTGWLHLKLRAEESCLASLNTRENKQQPTTTWHSRPNVAATRAPRHPLGGRPRRQRVLSASGRPGLRACKHVAAGGRGSQPGDVPCRETKTRDTRVDAWGMPFRTGVQFSPPPPFSFTALARPARCRASPEQSRPGRTRGRSRRQTRRPGGGPSVSCR